LQGNQSVFAKRTKVEADLEFNIHSWGYNCNNTN